MIFMLFIIDFTSLLFFKTKEKENKTFSWAPRRLKQIAGRPLAGVGTEEAAGGRNPGEELAGSEG